MMTVNDLKNELKSVADKDKIENMQRYFKTGKGEYAEGDNFLGVTVPLQRKISKKFKTLSLKEISSLLKENIHEYRLTAVFILVNLYARQKDKNEQKNKNEQQDKNRHKIENYQKTENRQKEIVDFYLNHIEYINNWDLVDSSAHKILGPYFLEREKSVLYGLANTNHLWSQRIAIIATFHFIKNNHFEDTMKIAEILLNHKHDLIHKAVGWMLREVGKIDINSEKEFLDKYYKSMPRTMLRYAIEKFPESLRQQYLKGKR